MRHGHTPLDWVFRQVWYPVLRAFDLIDHAGNPDHGKVIGFVVAASLIVLIAARIVVGSVGVIIVLVAAAFGQRVFIAFLRSRTVTSEEKITMTLQPLVRQIDHPDAD